MEQFKDNNVNESDCLSVSDSSELKMQFFNSAQLFGKNNEIQIMHEGELYRIRITRNGKLIMNK